MDLNTYWLWLSGIDLFSHKNTNILLDYFGSPELIWKASINSLYNTKLPDKFIARVIESRNEAEIENKLCLMEKRKISYISIEKEEYPQGLKNIYDYPYGIYIKGNLIKTKDMIAIVGSRKCSNYGVEVTKSFSRQLALNNLCIVSGMAKGIDSFAHKGALEANLKNSTIAVLGCGIDICYPKENYELMIEIAENGAIISEYPPGIQPNQAFFPRRNRIISGLSKAVIIVEAAKKSGSLITADLALDQGKSVFAVPGNITSRLSEGTNNLLKQGAIPLTELDDILAELNLNKAKNCDKAINNQSSQDEIFLAPYEKLVYDCISLEPQHIDIIFNKLDYPIDRLQSILTLLELKGYIQKLTGAYYVRSL